MLYKPRENKGECFGMKYLFSAIPRVFFQPAKFDNLKDETNSDSKTDETTTSKNEGWYSVLILACKSRTAS